MKATIVSYIFLICSLSLAAQPGERMIKVVVAPNHTDWKYAPGEKVKFDVRVTRNSIPLEQVEVDYEISYDMMKPFKKETITLKKGVSTLDAGTLKSPGFLRCRVFAKYKGNTYEGRATAAFSPEKILPVTDLPNDFVSYWDNAKKENANIPMDPRLRFLPERSSEKVNVYELSLQNYRYGSRVYGILCVPKASGKYPAQLRVPGAGVRPYNGNTSDAEKGVITLEIGIHGIPVTMNPSIYANLGSGALNGYQYFNWDNRDQAYYKRVYLGCVRAVDYIFSMPEFNGENIVVQGGSQGGALAIVTAALDPRIKGLVSFYPALCDLNGYLHQRAGGWPHLFRNTTDTPDVLKKKAENTRYYDVVNFARLIKVPGFYSFGYNDMVCPPTSMYAAYNMITAPKTLILMEEAAHFGYPEQWGKAWEWTTSVIKLKK